MKIEFFKIPSPYRPSIILLSKNLKIRINIVNKSFSQAPRFPEIENDEGEGVHRCLDEAHNSRDGGGGDGGSERLETPEEPPRGPRYIGPSFRSVPLQEG